jgi:dihydrofolate reductase
MVISLIAALARNRVIGWQGDIPWDLPADRRKFRELTMGHPLIMGRRTYESIGRPLPGRATIVLTRQAGYLAPGCRVAHSLAEALALVADADEVFICGGEEIYRQALPLAERLYLTLVEAEPVGDAWFPELAAGEFAETWREALPGTPPAVLTIWERIAR